MANDQPIAGKIVKIDYRTIVPEISEYTMLSIQFVAIFGDSKRQLSPKLCLQCIGLLKRCVCVN